MRARIYLKSRKKNKRESGISLENRYRFKKTNFLIIFSKHFLKTMLLSQVFQVKTQN